jgi:hypothetical protein
LKALDDAHSDFQSAGWLSFVSLGFSLMALIIAILWTILVLVAAPLAGILSRRDRDLTILQS